MFTAFFPSATAGAGTGCPLSRCEKKVTFKTFFEKAKIHPNAYMIKGVVCGYRIEEIEDEFELYKQCRRMEKLIDELAKGRKMEKILREEKK